MWEIVLNNTGTGCLRLERMRKCAGADWALVEQDRCADADTGTTDSRYQVKRLGLRFCAVATGPSHARGAAGGDGLEVQAGATDLAWQSAPLAWLEILQV